MKFTAYDYWSAREKAVIVFELEFQSWSDAVGGTHQSERTNL